MLSIWETVLICVFIVGFPVYIKMVAHGISYSIEYGKLFARQCFNEDTKQIRKEEKEKVKNDK